MSFVKIDVNAIKYKSHKFIDDTPEYYVNAKTFKCENCEYVIYLFKAWDAPDGQLYDGNYNIDPKDDKFHDIYVSCNEQNIKNIIK